MTALALCVEGARLFGYGLLAMANTGPALDTSGFVFPISILKAEKALGDMAAGAALEILATDRAASKDFLAFCKATGNSLIGSGSRDGLKGLHIRGGS